MVCKLIVIHMSIQFCGKFPLQSTYHNFGVSLARQKSDFLHFSQLSQGKPPFPHPNPAMARLVQTAPPQLRLNQKQLQSNLPACKLDRCDGIHWPRNCPLINPPGRNILNLLTEEQICCRCLNVKYTEDPTHVCGGSYSCLNKKTKKY